MLPLMSSSLVPEYSHANGVEVGDGVAVAVAIGVNVGAAVTVGVGDGIGVGEGVGLGVKVGAGVSAGWDADRLGALQPAATASSTVQNNTSLAASSMTVRT